MNLRYVIDLGTTTIDSCLYDMDDKKIIARHSTKNRQSLYGRDVLTRINAIAKRSENKEKLKNVVLDDISEGLGKLIEGFNNDNKAKISKSDISLIVISGNTTMISIIADLDCLSLGKAPFLHELKDSILTDTAIFEGRIGIAVPVILTGCLSAFIGGDILSGLYYIENTEHTDTDSSYLFIDLGTNGEMVVFKDGAYLATSASCGPAFENCIRRQGAYGSNLISAIDLCVKLKHITKAGVLSDRFFEAGIDINGIHIDMDILREFMLAKAAIRTGIDYLLDYGRDISDIYIAGGFGMHLDIASAVNIGLFPESFIGRTKIVENTSLKGGCILTAEAIDNIRRQDIKVIMPVDDSAYNERLLNNMNLEKR